MPRIRLKSGDHVDVVDWTEEPMHKLVLANPHTRIYKIRFPAHEKHETLYHRHMEDTVYLCVSDGGCQEAGSPGGIFNQTIANDVLEDFVPVTHRSGTCFCTMSKQTHLMHRIRTSELNPLDVVFIGAELLASPYPADRCAPPPLSSSMPDHYTLQLENELCRMHRLTVPPGGTLDSHGWDFSGVLMTTQPVSALERCAGSGETRFDAAAAATAVSAEGVPADAATTPSISGKEHKQGTGGHDVGGSGGGGGGGGGVFERFADLDAMHAAWFDGPLHTGHVRNTSTVKEFVIYVVERL